MNEPSTQHKLNKVTYQLSGLHQRSCMLQLAAVRRGAALGLGTSSKDTYSSSYMYKNQTAADPVYQRILYIIKDGAKTRTVTPKKTKGSNLTPQPP